MRLLSNSRLGIVGFEKAWQLLAALATLRLLSGYLGVVEFGVYQNATAILVIATAATWLCPAEALGGWLDGSKRLPADVFQAAFFLRVAVSLSVFAIIAVSTRIVYPDDLARWLLILLICFSVLHNEPVGLLRFELEAKGYLARLAVFRLVTSAARIVLMWAAIEMLAEKSIVVALLAVEQLINSVGYWICYRSLVGKPQISVSMLDVRAFASMVRTGAKYWLGFVALYFFVKFDRLFFSLRLDAHDYGIYAAGANMAEQVSSLGIMLVGVLAPAAIYAKSKAELVPALKRFVVAISLVGVAAAVTAFFLAPAIIFYIFGPKYAATLGVFKTLVIVAPLTYVDTAAAVFLFKMNRSDLFIRKSVVALAVAAVCVWLLYPLLGWRAAPLGNCLALLASIAVTASAYKNFKSIPHAQEN